MPTDSAERGRREKFRSSLENHEFHSQFSNLRKAGVSESKRAGLQDMDSFYDGQSVQTNPTVATQRKPPETDLGGLYFPERQQVFFPCSLESGKACGNVERTKFPQNNAESITRSSNYTPHETGQLVKNFKIFSWSRRKGEVICVWGCLTGLLLISCVTQVQHDKERLSCLAPWLITLSLSLFLLSSLIFDFNQSQVLCNRLSPLVFLMAFLACIVPKLLSPETPHLATELGESAEADEPVSLDVFLISSLPLLLSCAPVISWQNLSALSAAAVSSFLSLLVHINSTANPHRRQLIRFSIYLAITMLVSSCAISYFGHRAEDELMGIVIEWEETLKNASLNREEVLQAFEKNKHECSIKIKEMRNFISYIFHEIRVPFNAVVLGIGHLLGSDLSEDQCEVLKMMDASSASMIRILNDVLDMGKIEAGKLQLERQPFNMSELVRSLIWAFKDTFESKGLNFSLCIDQSTQDFLCNQDLIGDKHRVRQVLANYLSNAAKFTPRGGQVKLRVVCNGISFSKFSATDGDLKIRSGTESVEDNTPSEWSTSFPGEQVKEIPSRKSMNTASLTISVEDTGIGISKEDQEKLFEPYTQIGAGSAQGGGGTGLGLSFSKREQFVGKASRCRAHLLGLRKCAAGSKYGTAMCVPFPLSTSVPA